MTQKEQFDEFFDENPEVAQLFLMYTCELLFDGVTMIRAEEVLYRVRWELMMSGNYDLANRLKTVYGRRYAMEAMTGGAVPKGFFDLTEEFKCTVYYDVDAKKPLQ